MLVFGVDVPLIEIVLVFTLITFIILAEVLVIISLLVKQMNKTKQLSELLDKLSKTLLDVKSAEIKVLNKIKNK